MFLFIWKYFLLGEQTEGAFITRHVGIPQDNIIIEVQ